MGYTHYWYRPENPDPERFKAFAKDCREIIAYCEDELGIDLAGGDGSGRPEISDDEIFFNGSETQRIGQWTTEEEIQIPWPDDKADLVPVNPDPISDKRSGTWFAGHLLSQRTAPINQNTGKGEGSYETFGMRQFYKKPDWQKKKDLVFDCCKTAYRPYDITVTACLVAFKHHFPEGKVSSDGNMKNWLDGQMICEKLFGYGIDFILDE